MNDTEQQIKSGLNILSERVSEFCLFYQQNLDFQSMVYTYWTAKDVLGHVTFWHESFAKNLKDLSDGIKPNTLKGKLLEVNELSVKTTKNVSIKNLIKRLLAAQEIIKKHINNTSIESIPYKKGSRNYSRLEHLQIVEGHIKRHLNDLRNRKKNNTLTYQN